MRFRSSPGPPTEPCRRAIGRHRCSNGSVQRSYFGTVNDHFPSAEIEIRSSPGGIRTSPEYLPISLTNSPGPSSPYVITAKFLVPVRLTTHETSPDTFPVTPTRHLPCRQRLRRSHFRVELVGLTTAVHAPSASILNATLWALSSNSTVPLYLPISNT